MASILPELKRFHGHMKNAERVLLIAHKKPDGDTIGASSAFLNWCVREGKNVTAFCRDIPPQDFRYIDNLHRYTNDPSVFGKSYDIVIIFDSGDLFYCGVDEFIPKLPGGYLLVNIDHHATNTRFADLNIVDTDASSTAEIVYRFFQANSVYPDHAMATCMLTGLCTDTSNFSNAATNVIAIEAAGTLIAAGGRFHDILTHVWKNQSTEALRLWGLMLSRLSENTRYGIVSTYLLSSDLQNADPDLVDGISNFLSASVRDADVVMMLKEQGNGTIKGSFRSVRRDISKLAMALGGGGHKKAAGFTVEGRIIVRPDGTPAVEQTNIAL